MERYRYPGLSAVRRIANERILRQPSQEAGYDTTGADLPAHGSYAGLLFDQRWKARRATILERDLFRCVICREPDELQVHHRQYHFVKAANRFKPPWDYADELLITLCKNCHRRGHDKFQVPTIVT